MAQHFPMDHTFPEWIQQPFLTDMDDDDDLKELTDLQVNQACQDIPYITAYRFLV